MDWLGIGVFILAIGFAVLVFFLIPVLKRLDVTLSKTTETIEASKKSLKDISGETTLILHNTNKSLEDVNTKLAKLDPLFDIVQDTGKSAHHLTASLMKFTGSKAEDAEKGTAILNRYNLQGIIRGAAFLYYLREKKAAAGKSKTG
ncbi:Uncharacterized protein YoxC, contains an MCP-like domain [Evansella caseinilytica]|uniref:Uncharacterized protein YoxC, contains an MCP-like domain n=1 Tax=Evansella caseinilytica TaxID=1503961 RepID=A0A1H3G3A4_9BACI|nr:DUF948 domain-containing protein [Evansella caseinilytica]SDX97507.1 Uncharacterized protein YoxC, contains an MCP-like domain [Evansella caseinilytica]